MTETTRKPAKKSRAKRNVKAGKKNQSQVRRPAVGNNTTQEYMQMSAREDDKGRPDKPY